LVFSFGTLSAQEAWQAKVYGDDWEAQDALAKKAISALEKNEGIPATASDTEFLKSMPKERREKLDASVTAYYVKVDSVTPGRAGTKFLITAAREVEGFILLWVDEVEIRDGGRSLVYSVAKDQIITMFNDGGIRG